MSADTNGVVSVGRYWEVLVLAGDRCQRSLLVSRKKKTEKISRNVQMGGSQYTIEKKVSHF